MLGNLHELRELCDDVRSRGFLRELVSESDIFHALILDIILNQIHSRTYENWQEKSDATMMPNWGSSLKIIET